MFQLFFFILFRNWEKKKTQTQTLQVFLRNRESDSGLEEHAFCVCVRLRYFWHEKDQGDLSNEHQSSEHCTCKDLSSGVVARYSE